MARTARVRIIDFGNKEANARVQTLARDAVDRYFTEHKQTSPGDNAAVRA
jgi:hypothetical protein